LNVNNNDFENYNIEALNRRIDSGQLSKLLHFWTNVKKKFRYNRRDLFGIACELLFPVFFIIVGILLAKLGLSLISNSPVIQLNFAEVGDVSSFQTKLPTPQQIHYMKSSLNNNPYMNLELMSQFENQLNNISKGNLTLIDPQSNNGSSVSQWFSNLSSFD